MKTQISANHENRYILVSDFAERVSDEGLVQGRVYIVHAIETVIEEGEEWVIVYFNDDRNTESLDYLANTERGDLFICDDNAAHVNYAM